MTNAQQEIQIILVPLNKRIADLETRLAALKDIRDAAQDALAKYEPNLSGMTAQEAINYADESQYTEADKQAASLDPALVDLCSKTTIHADADGWYNHIGVHCPVEAWEMVKIKVSNGEKYDAMSAEDANWALPESHEERITHWKYAK